ncbi:hypothetical protein KL905_001837 [Ogataea polymorpha]|nr:hypothetical protein KL905_001837 [Ogataea polymorpha]
MDCPSPRSLPQKQEQTEHDLLRSHYPEPYAAMYPAPALSESPCSSETPPAYISPHLQAQHSGPDPQQTNQFSFVPYGRRAALDSSTSPPPQKWKLPRATLEQKIRVLDWHHQSNKKSQQHTVNHFKSLGEFSITKSTLNRWVLSEPQLREVYQNLTLNNSKVFKTRPRLKNPEINRCLEILYAQSCLEDRPLSEKSLISKWSDFYNLWHGLGDSGNAKMPPKSNGWLHHFKKKNSVKRELAKDFYQDRELFRWKHLDEEQDRLRALLEPYSPSQVFEIDEVSFNSRLSFLTGEISQKNEPSSRVVVSFIANSDGTKIFEPLVVSNTPVTKDSSSPNVFYHKNGLLTTEIFYKYMLHIDTLLDTEAVILLDTLHSHIIPKTAFRNIRLVYFSPNIAEPKYTYRPLDFGLKRIFKMLVKSIILSRFARSVSKLDIINAIGIAMNTIRQHPYTVSSFHRSQLIPQLVADPDIVCNDSRKENELLHLLNLYRVRGLISTSFSMRCLQNTGRDIDLEELLFPQDEEVENEHFTDQDIIALVKRELSHEPEETLAEPHNNVSQHSIGPEWYTPTHSDARESSEAAKVFLGQQKYPDFAEQYHISASENGSKRRRIGSLGADGQVTTSNVE